CTSSADCENPKVTMYPPSLVETVTTEGFANRSPEAFAYLAKRGFKNAQMNDLLAWMEDNQADGNIVMEHFLKNYESTWTPWVSSDTAAKVKKALASM
ncbi:MAG: hypothetical protein KAI73_08780, partial [Rhodospirillaceae bacterium]|nr:hypothetical protein [Rhodospirillaceae bacterium]